MARKQRPIVKGRDPNYTSEFGGKFKTIPTNMPPEVSTQPTPPKPPLQKPKEISPESKKPILQDKKIPPKDRKSPKSGKKPLKIMVSMAATPKETHRKELEILTNAGISVQDVIKLAGRKATARFKPSYKFVAETKGKLLGKAFRYYTSKSVETKLIETLRKKEDPLGLKSDTAMLRGQYEPLFWECLEEVIRDLKERYIT